MYIKKTFISICLFLLKLRMCKKMAQSPCDTISALKRLYHLCMRLSKMIVDRPVHCCLVLVILMLLIPTYLITHWFHIIKRVQHNMELDSSNARAQIMYEIQDTARLFLPMNSSAINLARVLDSTTGHAKNVTFSLIQTKVAPALFQALRTIPHISQISYIGLDGIFLSYYKHMSNNQTIAIYSNTSFGPNYTWYTQPISFNTGILSGQPTVTKPMPLVYTPWFKNATVAPNGYASLGSKWYNGSNHLLLNTARVRNLRGVISLGFDVEKLTSFFSTSVRNHWYRPRLHIVSNDEGEVLLEGIPRMKVIGDRLANNDDKILSIELVDVVEGEEVLIHGDVSCGWDGSVTNEEAIFSVGGKSFEFYCSPFNILGLNTVYILAFPQQILPNKVDKDSKKALALLITTLVQMFLFILFFVYLVVRASWKDMNLRKALIKQMESTQQAERKSLKKSMAVAVASHDIRNSLAAIKGRLLLCLNDAAPAGSELKQHLGKIKDIFEELLIMLNNILDTSKIDSGKMELQEEEFSLSELLEQTADLYYEMGMEKDVDVILDPCDGSVLKIPKVKGDRGKLYQILSNLVNNAVKFTSDGHVIMRAWVRRPNDFENEIVVSNQDTLLDKILHWFEKNERSQGQHVAIMNVKQDPNCMEFVFEVDDTGKGIPKEKRETVFENFLQLKETSEGKGGYGLGLGIVQSLVRLMGGDIAVVDKRRGEKGTCFRFTVLFFVPPASSSKNQSARDLESQDSHSPTSIPCTHSPNLQSKGSLVVLLIQNNGRRKVVQKYMETLGIKVVAIKQASHLPTLLKNIKRNPNVTLYTSSSNSSRRSSPSLYLSSRCSPTLKIGGGVKTTPLSSLDGADNNPCVHSQRGSGNNFSCILLVLDATAGDFGNLARSVADFRKDLNITTSCKIVWLEKLSNEKLKEKGLQRESLAVTDIIMTAPLHGSKLFKVIRLLPEFGGEKLSLVSSPKMWSRSSTMHFGSENYSILSHNQVGLSSTPRGQTQSNPQQYGKSKETEESAGHQQRRRKQQTLLKETQIQSGGNIEKPLTGKKILLVEDNALISEISMMILRKMGASVELSENGEKALALVRQGYQTCLSSSVLPYNYIFMDCEMPVMDGFEATRHIREEEAKYGFHIPIIALTAHEGGEGKRMKEAGMDFHLTKPLSEKELLEVIRCIHQHKYRMQQD